MGVLPGCLTNTYSPDICKNIESEKIGQCLTYSMETSGEILQANTGTLFHNAKLPAHIDPNPSSSPAFSTPIHPIRTARSAEHSRPSILPTLLPPATLRPLAFRTLTKKHNLTLTSSALQLFATFIGKYCGSRWREDGLAEKVLDEAAKSWKKNGNGVIVPGEGDELKRILRDIEGSLSGGRLPSENVLNRSFSLAGLGSETPVTKRDTLPVALDRSDSQASFGMSSLDVDVSRDEPDEVKDPRQWLKIVGAFDQPRLTYNVNLRHFEMTKSSPSFLPDPSHKTHLFRNRYNLIYQRLLRNESFQTSAVTDARTTSLQRSSSVAASAQQAYKIMPIANLLGRTGSTHLLLGILTVSPTGHLALNDLTGSVALDVKHARPVPEDGAWFTPGMIVLVDGIYEEEGLNAGPGLDGNRGVGGTIGGKFLAFSIGGPPCERREVTLGVIASEKGDTASAGGGFGWVDFLGVGSERAAGPAMRKVESQVFKRPAAESSANGRCRMVILGEVQLDNARTLQALRKIFGLYAADPVDQTPMVFILMGNFVHNAVMAGGGSGGSIEYKEYFDSLASALSDYPTMLQSATFVFVPGDNDPWASAFSAGAATVIPRGSVPELFTSRIRRVFAAANAEAEKNTGTKTNGEAIWSTNPTRLTMFGPTQEIVLIRDDLSSRLRRNAVTFRPIDSDAAGESSHGTTGDQNTDSADLESNQELRGSMELDMAVQTAESHLPVSKPKGIVRSGDVDLSAARKLVKTVLDQGFLSPFPLTDRPVLWDFSESLQLYPLPTAVILMDPEAPPFAVTYEGCHAMNPGPLTPPGKRGMAQWMEYDAKTRRGKAREMRI